MPGVLINWKSEQAYPRLIAALVASIDAKIDYTKIASLYGQGATYNSIEGRFRIIKKEALDLKAALADGSTERTPAAAGATVTPTNKNGKEKAEKKDKDKVAAGRVMKLKLCKGAWAGKGTATKAGVKASVESDEDKGMEENEEEEGADGGLIKEEI